MKLIIEIIGEEITACLEDGRSIADDETALQDMLDCTKSGDAEDAVRYILSNYEIAWRIIKRDESGEVVNVTAQDCELQKIAESIYFEADTDFEDRDNCELYLMWEVAHYVESEARDD